MHAADLPKISADSHIDEPHDLWYERLDADLRDRAPAADPGRAGRRLEPGDRRQPARVVRRVGASEAAANEEARVAAAAPDVRLDMMRTDGVNAEIIYPTIGLYAWNITDPTVGTQCCRVYNDWILERLGGIDAHPPRGDDPDVGRRDGDRRGRGAWRAHPLGRRAAAPARRHAGVEPPRVGTALGARSRRSASRRSCTRAPATT